MSICKLVFKHQRILSIPDLIPIVYTCYKENDCKNSGNQRIKNRKNGPYDLYIV